MTNAFATTTVVIGTGTTVTVYGTNVKKNITKKLVTITPPTSTGNWTNGAKTTKILDLLRIEIRFTITGYIDSADRTTLENYVVVGGNINMAYDGSNFSVNFEKYELTDDPKQYGEQDERGIMFTVIVGVNI